MDVLLRTAKNVHLTPWLAGVMIPAEESETMYIRPQPPKRRSNPWRVLILLLLIAAGIYAIMHLQGEEVESPFVPTPTPTRSAYSYRIEGDLLYLDGDLSGAIARYEQAIELAPDDVASYIPLVRLLALEGWVHKDLAFDAVERGEQAVALAPQSAPAWAVLCMAYDWDDRTEDAIDACLQARELDPTYAETYAYLAEAYVESGQWRQALEAAQTALTLAPNSVDANRAYGYVLENMGNWSGAIEAYRRAVEIHPNLAYLYMDLGRNYRYLVDTASAIAAYQRAIEVDPDRAEALDNLAWTYYAIGDYDLARTYLGQALEADPNYAPAYGHLAVIYWSRRDYEDTIPNLERTIELAYQASRRQARGFTVTVEETRENFTHPLGDVVLRGELRWVDADRVRLSAELAPTSPNDRWAAARGSVTLDTSTGDCSIVLEGMPELPAGQTYVGWIDGLYRLDGFQYNTGGLRPRPDGHFEGRLVVEPVKGPRIEDLYILGLCYFYMDECERAYPLFDAALQIDPEEANALEGIRLCQEAGLPTTPTP